MIKPIVILLHAAILSLVLNSIAGESDLLTPENLRPYMFNEEISGVLEELLPSSTSNEDGSRAIDQYTIVMERTTQQMLPGEFPKTPILAYGGITKNGMKISFPAPSVVATHKVPTKIKWVNNIYGPHMFAVDLNHPFNSSSVFKNEIPVIPHVHGIATKTNSDGQPTAYWTALGNKGIRYATTEQCGQNEAIFTYPNEQEPGLFWYHDHTMGITRLNVYAGLAGFYEIESATKTKEEQALESYYGDIEGKALVIADKSFKKNGELFYPNSTDNEHYSSWNAEFFGDVIVVNGKVWPKMVLKQQKYRIILLNACQCRYLNIYFLNNNERILFDLIRTEGDYFNRPVRVNQYLFSLSARIEIVLDLTDVSGDVFLKNDAAAPYPDGDPQFLVDQFTGTIIKLQVQKSQSSVVLQFEEKIEEKVINLKKDMRQPKPESEFGETVIQDAVIKTSSYPAFPEGKHIYTTIIQMMDGDSSAGMFIDGISFQKSKDCKYSKYKIGETYDLYMINLTPDSHPMHFHLINFQKIAEYPFDVEAYREAWYSHSGGPPSRTGYDHEVEIISPLPFISGESKTIRQSEKTFRDVVDMHPNYVTVIRMKIAHNDGSAFNFELKGNVYVFHCHMLEHEDNDMMRYFCIV